MAKNLFKKGVSGNPAGRPKGCKNKFTGKSREMIQNFCEGYLSKIEEDFEKLEPKERVKVFSDLLPFYLPKCQSITMSANVENQSRVEFYKAISEEYQNSKMIEGGPTPIDEQISEEYGSEQFGAEQMFSYEN